MLGEAIARLKKLFKQIFSKLSRSSEAQSLRMLTEKLEAIQKQYDALLERRATDSSPATEQQKNTSDRGVMSAGRSVAKNKKTPYNEYRTNAMQWAKSIGRAQSDRAVLFDPLRKKYYFIAPSADSDMGYIELASGTQVEMEENKKEYERTYDAYAVSGNIDKDIQRIRNEQNYDDWDNDSFGYVDKEKKNDGLPPYEIRQKANPNRARNPSGTRENFGGVEEFDDEVAMKSDRDSGGNILSKGQTEYFKYSKVRDENGNLLVMYHGMRPDAPGHVLLPCARGKAPISLDGSCPRSPFRKNWTRKRSKRCKRKRIRSRPCAIRIPISLTL